MNQAKESLGNSTAHLLYLLVSGIYLFQSLFFIIKIPTSTWSLSLSFTFSVSFLFFLCKREQLSFPTTLLTSIPLLGLAILLSTLYYDVSGDGQWYHQEIIIRLTQGWNPFYSTLQQDFYLESMHNFVQHYPKAFEIIASVIFKSSPSIETGKSVHLILIITIFLYAKNIFRHLGLARKKAILLSTLLSLNPVSLAQMFSYYVDGFLASLITLSIIFLYYYWFTQRKLYIFFLILSGILIINTKLTGFIFLIFLYGTYFIFLIIKKKKSISIKFLIIGFATFLLGFCIFGFHPFITNTLEKKHPLYPVFKNTHEAKEYLSDAGLPLSLQKSNHSTRLFTSLFAKTQTNYQGYFPVNIKIPFTIYPSELRSLNKPDIRLGGFGPLFGGIIILSAFSFLLLLSKDRICFIFLLGLISSVIIHPAAWWARFVPQLWLIPFLAFILLHNKHHIFKKILSITLLLSLTLNIALFLLIYLSGQTYNSLKIRAQLKSLAESEEIVEVAFDHYPSNRIRFKYWNVHYKDLKYKEDLTCKDPFVLEGAFTHYCSKGYENRFKKNFPLLKTLEGMKNWVVKKHHDT